MGNENVGFEGDLYLKLASGNLLTKAWEDMMYQWFGSWFGSAIAPKRIDSLAKTALSSFLIRIRQRKRRHSFKNCNTLLYVSIQL